MSLSYKDVADIIKVVDASSCDEVVIELAGLKLVVRRGNPGSVVPASSPVPSVQRQPPAVTSPTNAKPAPAPDNKASQSVPTGDKPVLRSPMVGTFYRSPSPNDPPFVEVGSIVKVGDPLCIIEVMKLFTTIEADRAGKITSIFPSNAELVEFGQPLFLIEEN